MRSSKQRQRNKQNRQNRPSGGNIINRVFESSGPEGKVRGTPQQIIEKYVQLYRDAQLAGDRVGAENFAQHAEHYTRMLAEAMREVERAREEQEQLHRERQAERERQFEQSRERQQAERQQAEREMREGRDPREQPREDRREDRRDGGFSRDRADRRPRQSEEMQPSGPGFLREPLFPVLVAEPEDDMIPPSAAPAGTLQEGGAISDKAPAAGPAESGAESPAGDDAVAGTAEQEGSAAPQAPARRPRRPRTSRAASAPAEEAAPPAPSEGAERSGRVRRPRKPRTSRDEAKPDAAG